MDSACWLNDAYVAALSVAFVAPAAAASLQMALPFGRVANRRGQKSLGPPATIRRAQTYGQTARLAMEGGNGGGRGERRTG